MEDLAEIQRRLEKLNYFLSEAGPAIDRLAAKHDIRMVFVLVAATQGMTPENAIVNFTATVEPNHAFSLLTGLISTVRGESGFYIPPAKAN